MEWSPFPVLGGTTGTSMGLRSSVGNGHLKVGGHRGWEGGIEKLGREAMVGVAERGGRGLYW
ncbi:hypothetical protein CC79DRAFT_1327855 [Sarocladium strictum]